MAPRPKATPESMAMAAMLMIDELGLEQLTARGLAARMGVSTAPIYRLWSGIDELVAAAVLVASADLAMFAAQHETDNPYLNTSLGIVRYAREHPNLYRAMFLERSAVAPVLESFITLLDELLKGSQHTRALATSEIRRAILREVWMYTHGLASLIATGNMTLTQEADLRHTLESVSAAIVKSKVVQQAQQRKGSSVLAWAQQMAQENEQE